MKAFFDTEFGSRAKKDIMILLKRVDLDKEPGQQEIVRTNRERISANCFLAIGEIADACTQADMSIGYLSSFHKKNSRSGAPITRNQYILYSVENVYIRLVSIFDRALILTNATLDLGFTLKQCRKKRILEHFKVQGSPVGTALEELDKLIEPYCEMRHSIIHHHRYSDGEFADIQGRALLVDGEDAEIAGVEREMFEHILRMRESGYVIRRQKHYYSAIDEIVDVVITLFDALLLHYKQNGMTRI